MNKDKLGKLEKLSEYFSENIYVVGGAVRNYLLGFPINDIDLAAAILPQDIFDKLKESEFSVSETSKKLYTLKISDNDISYEYTSFRYDSYQNGSHRPFETIFTEDIKKDAIRRDFTINSIYYDIKNKKIIDILNGEKDIENKIIRTVDNPRKVFSEDGLRLMRLVRQASELGFSIDEKTFSAAKENKLLIRDIAPERIRDEFEKIISADITYGIKNGHIRGMRLLDEIGLLDIILPELASCKGIKQRKDFHRYDVFNHILKAFEYAPRKVRLAALFHDIGKSKSIKPNGSMSGHEIEGEKIGREIMTRMHYSNKEIDFVTKLIKFHMYDLKNQTKDSTMRKFIQENYGIIDDLIDLKNADHEAGGVLKDECKSATRIQKIFSDMKIENVPMKTSELSVDGNDLIKLDVPEKNRGILLKKLLENCIYGGEMLKKENQIEFIKKNISQF